jgi:uracil permease
MPAVVIGPTVAIIGLSLAGNAVGDLFKGGVTEAVSVPAIKDGALVLETVYNPVANSYLALICGLVTLGVTIAASVYGKKMAKMIPFIIGIVAGYLVATVFTVIGHIAKVESLLIVDFAKFANMQWFPDFNFVQIFKGSLEFGEGGFGTYLATVAVAYVPVAFVVFAEHIADHKNISSIIESDLLEDPGLHRTLLGDGVGSMVGAFFGGCPNTTYGESVGCVAISGNASIVTIFTTAIMAIVASFFAPFVTFLATIPSCVMGGVCVALYGFIAVSGLKMIQQVDLGDNRNLFVVSVILIAGVGQLSVSFGAVKLTSVACALILGILTNVLVNLKKNKDVQK